MADEDIIILTDEIDDPLLLSEQENVDEVEDDGDFYKGKSAYQSYLDTTDDDPKLTEAEWVESLKGDKGDPGEKGDTGSQGAQGERGLQGIQGIQGERGIQGEKGEQGIQGIQGVQGNQGKSAYQSYLDTTSDNPVLSEAQWSNQLAGVLTILNSI